MALDSTLKELEQAQLIRRSDDPELTYLFKHTLTQELACESLLLKTRRTIHARVAAAIEQAYDAESREVAAVLAHHYSAAGNDTKTVHFAALAGDAAARVYANTEAIGFYSLAIEAARRSQESSRRIAELYLKHGRCLELLGHFRKATADYVEMQGIGRERGDRELELKGLIAEATATSIPTRDSDPAKGRTLSERALVLAREAGDREAEARILWNLLLTDIYHGGDYREAIRHGEESLAIARELGLREQIAYSLHDLFVAYATSGQFDKARAARTEASAIWRELANKPMLSESLGGLSVLEMAQGNYDAAFALASEGYSISRSIGNLGGQETSAYFLALVYMERGEWGNALSTLHEGLGPEGRESIEGPGMSIAGLIGWIYANTGDYVRARDWLTRGLRAGSASNTLRHVWLCALLTRLELQAGHVEAAAAAFLNGPVVATLGEYVRIFPASAPEIYLAAAELALAQGDTEHALVLLEEVEGHMREIGMRLRLPEVLWVKGRALAASGQTDRALEQLRAAHELARAIHSRLSLHMILPSLRTLEAEGGHGEEVETLDAETRELQEYISEHLPVELRRSPSSAALAHPALSSPS